MLCNAHYQEVYKHFKVSSTPCAGCGNCPRRGTAYTRHCPNPLVINDHMQNQLGIECHITPSDRICYVCYKLHNQILHNIQLADDISSEINILLGSSSTTQNNSSQHHPNTFNNLQTHQILHQASIIVNEMLHKENKKVNATRESIESNPNGLNIDEYNYYRSRANALEV